MQDAIVLLLKNEAIDFHNQLPDGHAKRIKIRRAVVMILWIELDLSRKAIARLMQVDEKTIDNDKRAADQDDSIQWFKIMCRAWEKIKTLNK